MYRDCGRLEDARAVFDSMPLRNEFSWAIIISAYVGAGKEQEALCLYRTLVRSSTEIQADAFIFSSVLAACARLKCLEQGLEIHERIVKRGVKQDVGLQNALVTMYAKCGRIDRAKQVFDRITHRDVVSWNAMVSANAEAGHLEVALKIYQEMVSADVLCWSTMISAEAMAGHDREALELYREMILSVRPNASTLATVLAACTRLGDLSSGALVRDGAIQSGLDRDAVVGTTLVNLYARFGDVIAAREVLFDSMKDRTVVSWNAMVTAFAQNARVDEAEKLFREMPDKSVISWNAMIAGFGQNGRPKQALELFRRMDLEGLQPSRMTYCSVLDACANLTASSLGRFICDGMDEALAKDISVANSICNMYGKCGLPELARQTFLEMTYRDVVSWTAIIAAYSQNGYSSEALDIFRIMVQAGVEPNGITLINTLSACSHGALFDEGSDIFSSLVSGDYYGVTANESHFLCAIDLLGRAGYLKDAETLITKMPFKAGAVAWTSLLSACRTFRDLKRAGRVANHLFELDESSIKDPAPYVMLSNIYASAGDRAAEMKLRDQIRIKCRKKLPGKSTITIKGQTNEFYSLDETHPRRDDAYNELRRLFQKMKEAGYVPDTRIAEMEEEETEQSLSYHSEKLALAFGVLNTPPEASLCIVKNLRVCSDCHNVIKFLSKHLNRKIAVRDATRFHHFENGFCSCRDCW
ncbi:hypothetical protein SELMODRAFT_98207 [Selaginella moellendorffii]|uniref:DYW domain-containing protein n=1 Tax=Selaginella moellendorffii TaxID=88036 RepID=D8RPB4_SELML|nr:hypothetical protein SELMODRAFT_98207 [Selaginella moellendorffii]